MSGCNLNEKQIKAAIHADAYSYDPPIDLKQRIDAQLAWQENKEVIPMKKFGTKKIVAAAALACALTGTVCMAAGKISYYVSSSTPSTEITKFTDLSKMESRADILTGAPKAFDNGFVFENAKTVDTNGMDDNGNVAESFTKIKVSYLKDNERLSYMVKKGITNYTDEELEHIQVMESDDITYYFTHATYLFLPPDAEPTAEDLKAAEAGDLFISYGSSEREEQVYKGISWNADGNYHSLFGMDIDMDADEMLAMAKQIK